MSLCLIMKIEFGREICFDKVLNSLDKFTIDFTKVLNELRIKYVIVSGYVAILFGRSRSSEDVDLIVEKLSFEKFKEVWQKLQVSFDCIITDNPKEAYTEYLLKDSAIRFARKGGDAMPNMEFKFPEIDLHMLALETRKKVVVSGNVLFISSLELQIAFKLYLGSGKDIEDAKHLYELFSDKLDMKLLDGFFRKLNIESSHIKYLK